MECPGPGSLHFSTLPGDLRQCQGRESQEDFLCPSWDQLLRSGHPMSWELLVSLRTAASSEGSFQKDTAEVTGNCEKLISRDHPWRACRVPCTLNVTLELDSSHIALFLPTHLGPSCPWVSEVKDFVVGQCCRPGLGPQLDVESRGSEIRPCLSNTLWSSIYNYQQGKQQQIQFKYLDWLCDSRIRQQLSRGVWFYRQKRLKKAETKSKQWIGHFKVIFLVMWDQEDRKITE